MRILVVSSGGIAAERPVQWLVAAGHQVCLVSDGDFFPNHHPENYRFFQAQKLIETWIDETTIDDQATEHRMAIKLAPRLREIATEFQPDVIHTNGIGWYAYSCALAGLHPLVVSAWGFLNFLLYDRVDEHSELGKFVLKHTDLLIVENPKLVEPSQALLPPGAEIALLPLGVDTARFHRGATRDLKKWKQDLLKVAPDTFIFLSPRGLGRGYGQEYIMQAYILAYPHFQQSTQLVMCGMGRSTQQDVQEVYKEVCQQAEAANLREHLHWLPHFPHLWMPTLYNLADVVVNYLGADAFPSTLLEAAACECTIISSDLPAYRGTIFEQICTLTAPRHPQALAETMIQVANQSLAEHQEHCDRIRQQVIEQFDEAIWKQRFLQTLEQVGQQTALAQAV
ncbi:glycosyltransferase [Leptolyngbya boryana NIES-2135]|jgi:glycosyltransferase involved in cell wall biosynthesis|uniref:Glycosyltransferase n=1 Tax=Leptolyngbya boryana NIES-2135 TaxID=1973484 RepID=A0A1Z4JIW2_LEPBY|nr:MULTISPECIES: glycosyltransferase [Leptolyngbya]BAY56699.1 glycosyltransferase [Leptolyngbya boryana NIES-2135]MBD2369464.1 glycosyltransferase [Leptolyngbya sp. FACHB-161]MBD2376791.1 glycosyltransferase [Leptolyngbya sp. FACHB-238]MBD2401158.1 glycosyltransferase [Leptolyngbya sp. FACHB-239]MBD2407709.1 glycosyltransferase [Leptolyngbya sp. FACHB-402]